MAKPIDRSWRRTGALLALLCVGAAAPADPPPWRPFPQHVTYAPGTLRPAHRSQFLQDDDVRALYQAWKSRYLADAGLGSSGQPRFRVRYSRAVDAPTVSEGQGYGLVVVALMAGEDPQAQVLFDGLLEFALEHPSTIDGRLMDWYVGADGGPDPFGDDSAFDGDASIAYALLLAREQWGASAHFDYAAAAGDRLAGLAASAVGPASRLPMLGDWVEPGGAPYSQYSPRPSDCMPHSLRAFARATRQGLWSEVVAACRELVEDAQTLWSPGVGLLPDFLVPAVGSPGAPVPAPADFLEGPFDGDYYYNSTRVPLWLALDALTSSDAASLRQGRRVASWALARFGGDPQQIAAGFHLDGSPLPGSAYFTTAFAAPLAVAAMLDATQPAWLEALYESVRSSDEDYYEDTLSLFSLLVLSGNFWTPERIGGVAPAVPGLSGAAQLSLAAALFVSVVLSTARATAIPRPLRTKIVG